MKSKVFRTIWLKAGLDKKTISEFVLELKPESRKAWFNTWYKAEGTLGRRNIVQQNGENLDALELCAFLEGNPGVKTSKKSDTCSIVSWHEKNRTPRRCKAKPEGYGPVWCPKTELGTWTAKSEEGFIFLTGNTWWIRQAINRGIADKSRTIRVPVHMHDSITKFLKTKTKLTQELRDEPTLSQIAKAMNVTMEKVNQILKANRYMLSLDCPLPETESKSKTYIQDYVEIDSDQCPEAVTDRRINQGILRKLFIKLLPREAQIIKWRYGILDNEVKTLQEISIIYELTKERVRQIEQTAMKKLMKANRLNLSDLRCD
mgnify:CR=1 FL=1